MNAIDILIDFADRPRQSLAHIAERLTPEVLNVHPLGHDNSIAWLLWHAAREADVQLSMLSGEEEVWTAQDFRDRLDLGEVGDGVGYGHAPEQARSIRVEDPAALVELLGAVTDAMIAYLRTLAEDDLGEIIDEAWDPPVTRGQRLASIVDDAAQHIGQAAYVLGMDLDAQE